MCLLGFLYRKTMSRNLKFKFCRSFLQNVLLDCQHHQKHKQKLKQILPLLPLNNFWRKASAIFAVNRGLDVTKGKNGKNWRRQFCRNLAVRGLPYLP